MQRSTKTTDKTEAKIICAEMEKIAKGRGKRLTPKTAHERIKAVVEDLMASTGQELPSTTTRDYFEQWIKDKKDTVAIGSWRRYGQVVQSFLDFLKGKADQDIFNIETKDIQEYARHVKNFSSPHNANDHLTILKIVFRKARDKDRVITENPALAIDPFKYEKQERQPFTKDQLKAIYEHASTEWKAIISLGLFTGQRVGDICNLRWNQINFETQEVSIKTAKTGRRVILPLRPETLKLLNMLPRSGNELSPVFPKWEGRRSSDLSSKFRSIMEAAGVVEKRQHRKYRTDDLDRRTIKLSFHCLRHTLTSWLKRAGVSNAVAQDMVGHDSVAVSNEYTHMDMPTKRSAIDTIENPFEDDNESKVVKLKA